VERREPIREQPARRAPVKQDLTRDWLPIACEPIGGVVDRSKDLFVDPL